MDGKGEIKGLREAMRAMAAAFPKNPEQQRRLLSAAMRGAAKNTILRNAKLFALAGDGSGALSESLGIRTQSRRKVLTRLIGAGVQIAPVRNNRKAMALYINHYYTQRGRTPPAHIVTSGIRHGHLVEFGTKHSAASPFLWPAAQSAIMPYKNQFSVFLKKRTEAAVRRAARLNKKR